MAKAPAGTIPPIIQDLLQHPHRFTYIQAVRLLRFWASPQTAQELDAFLRHRLRIRPALSLAFATSDISELELTLPASPKARNLGREQGQEHGSGPGPFARALPDNAPFDRARISATFLGLYGASSPLPRFYTERLLEEQADDCSVTRDFLDIFNNQFFFLHTLLSSYTHPFFRRMSGYDPKSGSMLMALASFGNPALCGLLPDEDIFLRYSGFFFQATRTATGLRTILADASGCAKTEVVCNVLRLARIPEGQRFRLGIEGTTLGEDATLGDAVPSYEGKIRIQFTEMDEKTFRSLLPGTRLSGLLHTLLRNYCRQPLDYAVLAHVSPGEAKAACLGGARGAKFASLGHDTWLGFGGQTPDAPLPGVTASFSAGFKPFSGVN